jgi:hypothetical protein
MGIADSMNLLGGREDCPTQAGEKIVRKAERIKPWFLYIATGKLDLYVL